MSGLALSTHRSLDPGHGVPTVWTHVAAWLHRGRLDRELATGIPSWDSRRHAARALQLTRRAQRRSLAVGLSRIVAEARRPTPSLRRLSCISPCRPSVLRCAPLIEDLTAVLEGELPLDAQQVARLRILTRDGVGPLYVAGRSAELPEALARISAGIIADD